MKYAGFWKRFGAFWLDFIIMIPIMAFAVWGNNQFRLFDICYLIPGTIFGVWFNVYLVKRYGGTPGKLLLKIKITKLDGSKVGYKEAFLRDSVMLLFSFVTAAAQAIVIFKMSDEFYFSMEWRERSSYIYKNMPTWYSVVYISSQIWIWSEFVVLLLNKKRRALHDYLAGTVVIHKRIDKATP